MATAHKQDDGSFLNDDGQVVNEEGLLLDEEGNVIDESKADDGEPDGGKPDDGKPDDDDKEGLIARSRYNKMARRAREAEAALKRQEREQQQGKGASDKNDTSEDMQTKIDELDEKIEDARRDGDADQVVRLTRDQRQLEREMYSQIAKETATNAGSAAQQNAALDTLINQLEQDYSQLNPESDDFDQELVDEINELQAGFVHSGNTPAQAMAKAVGYIIPDRPADSVSRKTDVDKNLDAANRMAPSQKNAGLSSDKGGDKGNKVDVLKMSAEEIDALPEETKKRLRGDFYEAQTG